MEIIDKIKLAIQKWDENKLTNEIIIPTLKNMGYNKIEFHGGNPEYGKDIVLWDVDKFGDTNLHVAQVKHFKFSKNAASKQSLQTVVNQLTTCLNKSILDINKKAHFPNEVILISTYDIDSKVLSTHFDSFPALKDNKLKIIDGSKLASLIFQYNEEVLKLILGSEFEINRNIG